MVMPSYAPLPDITRENTMYPIDFQEPDHYWKQEGTLMRKWMNQAVTPVLTM